MANVMLNYGAIALAFWNHPDSKCLLPCVQKRWADCEQPLFVMCLLLHPKYNGVFQQLPETDLTSMGQLGKFATMYYKRFIDDDVGDLRLDVMRWHQKGLS
ncbi:hypothetical protein H310_14563 [Aphanomyces invadans]|uniref:Uncharacterized protein n=1 Tax=Aphanomyces invadans TaxID=157072 RepID=A0A024T9I9_9STRA|nr:hypothetical protein H310_14563 [Aphanomyces invadans]ETV90669.1 hypothetical protein H310_14563 [Aphanomyces invadans]|eukprot:XP_008880666.1 hypothetical protein H310_14563 [Aphanomyces invadans]